MLKNAARIIGIVMTFGGGLAFFISSVGYALLNPERTQTQILMDQWYWLLGCIVVTLIGVWILSQTEK